MTCQRVLTENLVERYLQGSLDPELRDDFELHYFACESCLAQLQTAQAIQPVLASTPPPPLRRRRPILPWLGLAAAAVVTVALLSWPKPSPAPAPVAAVLPAEPATLLLSEIRPAPYSPTLFRDGASSPPPELAAAMSLYQDRQWGSAAQALALLSRQSPPNPVALHFAGISNLLAGHTEAALDALDRVIALGQNTPFEEEARFYRAQALLLLRRLPQARQELQRIVQGRGDYEAPARSLLNRF